MSLNLNDLIKKAATKGITGIEQPSPLSPNFRSWQQESTLFSTNKKVSDKPTTNRQQTDNKPTTNRQQTDNKPTTNRQQSGDATDNKVVTQPTTNRQQSGDATDNKPTTNRQQSGDATDNSKTDNKMAMRHSFSSLVGLQRTLALFIYDECTMERSKSTGNLTLEYISKIINASAGCVKTTLQRLELKGFIERIEYKNGRGGWSKYSIPDQHFKEILHQSQTDNKVVTQPTTAKPPFSSSLNNNKLTNKELTNNLSGLVDNLNYPELGYWQIEPNVVTPKQFQTWLNEFELTEALLVAYLDRCRFEMVELGREEKLQKGSAVNWFYGVMKKRGGSYPEPPGYKSIQQLKLEEEKKILEQAEAIEIERQEVKLKQEFAAMMADSSSDRYQNHFKALGQYAKNLDETGPAFRAIMWEEFKKQNTISSLNASSN